MDGNLVHVRLGPPKVNHRLSHVTSFSRGWLLLHQSTKWSTSPLNSLPLLPLTHPMTTESWENFCKWQESDFLWKSEDYIVKCKVESTGPRGPLVLLTKLHHWIVILLCDAQQYQIHWDQDGLKWTYFHDITCDFQTKAILSSLCYTI